MSKIVRNLIEGYEESVSIWNLYKNKPLLYRLRRTLYVSSLLNPLFKVYYKADSFVGNIRRVIEFIPYVWAHRDWDYSYILTLNTYLHARLLKALKHGSFPPNKGSLRGLQTTVELYKRIAADEYYLQSEAEANRRFGPNDLIFGLPGAPNQVSTSRYQRAIEEGRAEEYRNYVASVHNHEKYLKNQDIELLGKLIKRYNSSWWD